jgi:hypothetical protein
MKKKTKKADLTLELTKTKKPLIQAVKASFYVDLPIILIKASENFLLDTGLKYGFVPTDLK